MRISGVRIYGLGGFSRSFARGDSLSSKGKLAERLGKKMVGLLRVLLGSCGAASAWGVEDPPLPDS